MQNRLCHRFNSDDHLLSPVDCAPRSSKSHVISLTRSKHYDATVTQQRTQEVTVPDTGEADSSAGIIKDTETVGEETSHYNIADNNQSQSLLSEDKSLMYSPRHHNQNDNSDISVDHHGSDDSSLLCESSAGNEIDSSGIQLLNAHNSQYQEWESQTNMSTKDSMCSEMPTEDCAGTSELSKRSAKRRSKSVMTVTVTAEVHAHQPELPLMSPPLFSDTSFAGEEEGICIQPSQAEEESAEEVEQVGDLVMLKSHMKNRSSNLIYKSGTQGYRNKIFFGSATNGVWGKALSVVQR